MAMRTALVTGARRGIGAAVAAVYHAAGYRVIAPARDDVDLSSPEAVAAYAREVEGPVDVLVNNAGENVPALLEQLDFATWDRTLRTNLTAPFLLTREFAPQMAR